MGRREEVLDSAVDVLAATGSRGLSHRAVDIAAETPAGTTSNYFRSRRDLVLGTRNRLLDRLVERPLVAETPTTEAELVRSVASLLRDMLGSKRNDTIAHTVLLFDAVADEELAVGLYAELDRVQALVAGWLAAFGVEGPERNALVLIGYLRSLMFGELIDADPDFDPEAAVEPLVLGMLP